MRIVTLSENTAGRGNCLGEWGLSILIETEEVPILLDTGKSYTMTHNAEALGINLKKIERVVLSHGHSDHTGGLRDLLSKTGERVEIIAHPDVWQAKYVRREDEPERFIGIPFQREELESLGGHFHLTSQPFPITKDVMTTGEVPMVTPFEEIDTALLVKEGSHFKPDGLLDDQALVVTTKQGLVVILGCAHRGMINTLYHAQKLSGITEIHMVVGGSHLIGASEERLWQTIAALRELGVQKLGLCHCTDLPAAGRLAQEFGENFFFNKAGTVIHVP